MATKANTVGALLGLMSLAEALRVKATAQDQIIDDPNWSPSSSEPPVHYKPLHEGDATVASHHSHATRLNQVYVPPTQAAEFFGINAGLFVMTAVLLGVIVLILLCICCGCLNGTK